MRPEFEIAIDFFKRALIEKGFSGNLQWLFRENILAKQGSRNRYKFVLNPDLNKPNENVKEIYNKLREGNNEIFFFTFIKDKDLTYVTIAGDDFDFEIEEGDLLKEEWNLKFGFSSYYDFELDEIEVVAEDKWSDMQKQETKDIGPFDYFYLAEYFM